MLTPFFLVLMVQNMIAKDFTLLIEAKNLKQLVQSETSIYREGYLDKGCDHDKNKKLFPEHCLELLDLNFHKLTQSEIVDELSLLNGLCIDNITQLQDEKAVDKILKNSILPKECRKALVRHHKDLIYVRRSD